MRIFPTIRKRVLAEETRQNLRRLLSRMDSKTTTTISDDGYRFSTRLVTGGVLKENNNAVYGSNFLLRNKEYPLAGTSSIRFNNKEYIVDNVTGEVKHKKSLLNIIPVISKKTFKGITDTINRIKEHFENPEIVDQHCWGMDGFTEKGSKAIQEAQAKIYSKQRTATMIQNKW